MRQCETDWDTRPTSVSDHVKDEARKLAEAVRDWAASLPTSAFALTEQVYLDEEFGSCVEQRFEPATSEACALRLIIVPDSPPRVSILLDSWARLLASGHLQASPVRDRGDYVVLGREPFELPVELLLRICEAVAQGRVIVEAATAFGRLSATTGGIQLESEFFRMNGVAIWPLSFIKLLSRLGLGEVITLRYEPWI